MRLEVYGWLGKYGALVLVLLLFAIIGLVVTLPSASPQGIGVVVDVGHIDGEILVFANITGGFVNLTVSLLPSNYFKPIVKERRNVTGNVTTLFYAGTAGGNVTVIATDGRGNRNRVTKDYQSSLEDKPSINNYPVF